MKKYKSIAKAVLLSCTLALTTSCNDFLDKAPDDQLTMEMIFTDKIRTEVGRCLFIHSQPHVGGFQGTRL